MSQAEFSTTAGIPINTLKDYRAKGKGPQSAVIGGRVKYRRADVLNWIDQQFEQSGKGANIAPRFQPLGNRSRQNSSRLGNGSPVNA